ncbi:hypothetical protein MJO28_008274 [Puccinia striiformis f. sp. tritici]|uniref:FAD-binding domain-containing protein n=3 Tax=Puccinia striiformis TaxID=27350 RepID=A0A0L0VMS6_9BASI|nr:hypothetical protein Pst134EA_015651 [Puccinia striiformis f. sp. tritici]KAI9602626.1 hypothetical protein H4Q26_001917 [Puccinia striiformis f. sp. tritici PST-130]KNF00583.1 hypothetical protein PSTG_06276 [Puccinia striiformis f. sp. tritici PST-78]POW03986.1 hypothetical protein PSHT_11452 [Puccinia striiformis]KAH9452809.1 hypothetical protein Pst134EB_016761 [Puccinia striiformis f. sp. tritici]KAH9463563.1 hypothetical protein Pst134EA_015651 [Puccinia striiformis f. sp. tritici]
MVEHQPRIPTDQQDLKKKPSPDPNDASHSLHVHVNEWIRKAQSCFESNDIDRFVDLFADQGYWRDILTIELEFNSLSKNVIKSYLEHHKLSLPVLKNIALDRVDQLKRTEEGHIRAFIKFETDIYRGTGLVMLKEEGRSKSKAFLFFTQVWELKGHEEKLGIHRPLNGVSLDHSSSEGRAMDWLEERLRSSGRYKDGVDPTVLIVGGGQNGLSLAAQLRVLGIDSLIIEKTKRLGDCWRSRYHSLCLHDPARSSAQL